MYTTLHVSAEGDQFFEYHETNHSARIYAREVLEEQGGQVTIYMSMQTLYAEGDMPPAPVDMDRYNGVRQGIDYPGTLNR